MLNEGSAGRAVSASRARRAGSAGRAGRAGSAGAGRSMSMGSSTERREDSATGSGIGQL